MGLWSNFVSGSSENTHTPYAAMGLAFILSTPVILLSSACIIYHVFIKEKGLDAPTVNLLLGMLGAATGGVISAGVSMFSKVPGVSSLFTKTTTVSESTQEETGEGKHPPPKKG